MMQLPLLYYRVVFLAVMNVLSSTAWQSWKVFPSREMKDILCLLGATADEQPLTQGARSRHSSRVGDQIV